MHEIRPRGAARIRARSTVLAVLTAVTLGLTTAGTATAQQAAHQAPKASPHKAGSTNRAAAPVPATATSAFPKQSGERCEATKAGSKERRAGAVEACVSTSPILAARTTAQPKSLAATATTAAATAASCSITAPGNYSYERFSYCVTGVNVLYLLRDSNGAELGRGTLTISTSASLPASGTTWSEQVTVTMTAASGEVTALNAKFRAACGTGCTATKTAPWYNSDLVLGQSLNGTVTYSSAPAAGAVAEFLTSYKLYVTSPGATAIDPNASWDNPRKIRCDNAVGGTSTAGCVIPSIMPVVPMSAKASDAGGAVATYAWAQQNLDGGWGKKGKPLTRSTSGVANRTASTCGGFTPETEIVENDSCGDFPFGEAKEGGAAGAQCVKVIPNLGNGEWDTYILNDARDLDRTSPCVQAHVTPAEKQYADNQLADGFKNQRVIDADQFELTFSLPDTGPQASCLNDPAPFNSLPNGDGWFLNTKEAVPLINKSEPADGSGYRPTRAQACVGLNVKEGTDTSNPVTGMKDAVEYAKTNNLTYDQSRCHLIPKVLGGKGTSKRTRFNLVPCWQVGMNTGTPSMRTYEKMAEDLVKGNDPNRVLGTNDAVFYQVTPVYNDATSTIPVGVTMSAYIERANGTTEELFPNVYVTNTYGNTGLYNLGN
ncbi:DNA/RNA non-specific endonuclease [Streptomyces sp. OV198]|uniref:DNA/RNA non-specific endonuclease n=1 Tax=Streptomyces sp. OV198 TaxID=1882787 RepID=UPI0015CF3267|nr:DNA/RNA non-specific endonuclease [Streptomyces sp. OV198]